MRENPICIIKKLLFVSLIAGRFELRVSFNSSKTRGDRISLGTDVRSVNLSIIYYRDAQAVKFDYRMLLNSPIIVVSRCVMYALVKWPVANQAACFRRNIDI